MTEFVVQCVMSFMHGRALQQIARELTADSDDDECEVNKMNGMGNWHLFKLLSVIMCTWQIE